MEEPSRGRGGRSRGGREGPLHGRREKTTSCGWESIVLVEWKRPLLADGKLPSVNEKGRLVEGVKLAEGYQGIFRVRDLLSDESKSEKGYEVLCRRGTVLHFYV